MSKYSDVCGLCLNPSLSETLLKAEACVYRGGHAPYAALETHLHPVSIPSVTQNSFMGSATDVSPCCACDSVASTILAVCNSVKKLNYMVHIVRSGELEPRELAEMTSCCMGGKECVVLSVPRVDESGAPFLLSSSSAAEDVRVSEDSAMRLLLRMTSAFDGVIWYWSADLLGYSYILNVDEKSMWMASVRSPDHGRSSENQKMVMPSSEKHTIRVLPFFYSSKSSPVAVVMGTGGTTGVCKADLAVEMYALSRSVVDRAYSSTTSTGRCFCCQYLDNIHSTFHSSVATSSNVTHRLTLSKQFRQRTKSYNGNREK
jgi:hypothetical protein